MQTKQWVAFILTGVYFMVVQGVRGEEPKPVGFQCFARYEWVNYPMLQNEAVGVGRKYVSAALKGALVLSRFEKREYEKMLTGVVGSQASLAAAGCSGDWRQCFVNDKYLDMQYISVLGMSGEGVACRAGYVEQAGEDPGAKGKQLGEQLKSADGKLIVVYSTAHLAAKPGAASEFLKGLLEAVGKDVLVIGSVMPVGEQVFCGKKSYTNAVVGLALGGKVKAAMTGYQPFVELARHKVTRAEGRKIFELDGKPVAEVYGKDVYAVPRGLQGAVVGRKYPWGEVAEGRLKVVAPGSLQADGSYELEEALAAGSEIVVLKQGEKALAELAQEALAKVKAQLGGCRLVLLAGDIYTWDSFAGQQKLLENVIQGVEKGTQVLGWFGQGEITSLDGVRALTSYVVGITGME